MQNISYCCTRTQVNYLRDSNIVEISGALFQLRIQYIQTLGGEGARDVNNIWALDILMTMFQSHFEPGPVRYL